jgi:hypothetical protein
MAVVRFDEFALLFSFWSALVFIVGYTAFSPWWRYRVGRALVALDAALFVTLLPSSLHLMFGFSPRGNFFGWYDGVAFIAVGLTALWRLWVVWRVQTESTPRHGSREAAPLLDKEVSQ